MKFLKYRTSNCNSEYVTDDDYVEINSLEELIKLCKKEHKEIIIIPPDSPEVWKNSRHKRFYTSWRLEIYDGYRE